MACCGRVVLGVATGRGVMSVGVVIGRVPPVVSRSRSGRCEGGGVTERGEGGGVAGSCDEGGVSSEDEVEQGGPEVNRVPQVYTATEGSTFITNIDNGINANRL